MIDRGRSVTCEGRVGVTRPAAGVLWRAYTSDSVPRGTLSIGVEADSLTDRKLLLERELKRRSDLVAV